MEGEQERRGKTEEMMRAEGISLQTAGRETSVAEETENATSTGDNRACSDGESREDRGSNGASLTEGRVCSKEPIYHRC